MTKKEFAEQAKKAAELHYDLWRKNPDYVVSTQTLATNREGVRRVQYNIYTPDAGHNNFADFQDFVRFTTLLIENGVKDVRIKVLENRLVDTQAERVNAIDEIADIKKELEKLNG